MKVIITNRCGNGAPNNLFEHGLEVYIGETLCGKLLSQNNTSMCEDYIIYCIPGIVGNYLKIKKTINLAD